MSELADAFEALHGGVAARSIESETLEFKEQARDQKETFAVVADAVVCLANHLGGVVTVGVSDSPGARGSFLGVSTELTIEKLVRAIFDRTRPQLSVSVSERHEAGARLLVVSVPRGAVLYSNARGTATRRVGRECRPFPPEEQKQALAARGDYDWSAAPLPVGLGAVDPREVAGLRSLLSRAGRDELESAPDERVLEDLRLLEGGALTRAGLLLVGREDELSRFIPAYGYSYAYRPSSGAESSARLRGRRPLLAAIEHVLDAVATRRSMHPLNIRGGLQVQLYDFGPTVVRELLVNALVHRDYEFAGSVDVEHSPDELTISSPGGLVFGVTPDNILSHPSTPRNRLLLETLTSLRFAERAGLGVDRVYRELLGAGKAPPEFADDGMRVQVRVPGGTGDDSFARFVNVDLDQGLAKDLDVLMALTLLRQARLLRAERLAASMQRSESEAQRVLDRIAAVGLVEATRRTSRSSYPSYALTPAMISSLGRAVAYARRSGEGVDQKVIEHVTEYGFVTNATLRRTFDLNVYAARDLLKDLQQRELLRKIDDKTSGPGIRYGPGSCFPAARAGRRATRPES